MPAFTLTMLGTDTNYSPKFKSAAEASKDYPKGETLSVVTTLIATEKEATLGDKERPYRSADTTLINGPLTKGSDVNTKIALGVSEILNAIVRGNTTLNIIGHSRGAVESILVSHEIDAIQKTIEACDTIEQLINKLELKQNERFASKTSNTGDIFALLKKDLPQDNAAKEEWFKTLKANIPNASINLFGIDPVPGDLFPITWYDDRFYTLPEIIKNAEIVYYENERSYLGFTPIVPEKTNQSQNFFRQSIPGHHGTGSAGNNQCQQRVAIAADRGKTTHVQKLLLFKLLGFLSEHEVKFKDAAQLFKAAEDKKSEDKSKHGHALGRKYIQWLGGEQLPSEKQIDIAQFDFPAIYRKLYAKIAQYRKTYELYNKSNYMLMRNAHERSILQAGGIYELFDQAFFKDKDYVNTEHGRLMREYFFKLLKLDKPETYSLESLINQASEQLQININALVPHVEGSFHNIAESEPLLISKSSREDILKNFAMLTYYVSQQYLTNEWNTPEKQREKKQLFATIKDILTQFNELAKLDNDTAKGFVKQLITAALAEINSNIKQQYLSLESALNRLQESPDKKLIPFFNDIMISLNLQENHSEEEQNQADVASEQLIKEIIASNEYRALEQYPLNAKVDFIAKKLDLRARLAKDINIIEQVTKNFAEQHEDHLENFTKQYQHAQIFIQDIAALRELTIAGKNIFEDAAIKTFNQYELSLRQKAEQLIDTAAQRFYNDRPNHLPQRVPGDSFREQIEHHAINNYGVIDRSKAEYESLSQKRSDLQSTIEQRQKAHNHQQQQLEQQNKSILEQKAAIAEQLATLQEVKNNLEQQLSGQQKALQIAEQNKLALNGAIDVLAQQLKTQEKTLADSAENNKILSDEVNVLQQELLNTKKALLPAQQNNLAIGREARELRLQLSRVENTLRNEEEQNQRLNEHINELDQQVTGKEQQRLQEKTDADQQLAAVELERQELIDAQARLQAELAATKQKNAEYHQNMNNPQEADFLRLISKQLRPLTEEYLNSLNASKKASPQKNEKIAALTKLLDGLNNDQEHPKASDRVNAFYTELNASDATLRTHRDPAWARYLRNAFILVSIIITGIVPGLVVVGIYTNKTGKTPFAFWQPQGAGVVTKLKESKLPEAVAPNDNNLNS